MTITTNYGWLKPTVGGDIGSWGTEVNTTLDSIDSQMKTTDNGQVAAAAAAAAAQTTANAALPKAGGTMTGMLNWKNASAAVVSKGNVSGAVTVDLTAGDYQTVALTGNVTLTLGASGGSGADGFILIITNTGSFTITWFTGVKWPNGVVPQPTPNGTDIFVFLSDGTLRGIRAGRDVK